MAGLGYCPDQPFFLPILTKIVLSGYNYPNFQITIIGISNTRGIIMKFGVGYYTMQSPQHKKRPHAAIVARTKKIRVGTGVLLLPLHDSVRVEEEAMK